MNCTGTRKKKCTIFYFVMLCVVKVLVQFPEVTLEVIMKLVRAHLQLGRGGKPSEEKEASTGKAFALLALLQSGRLTSTVRRDPFGELF